MQWANWMSLGIMLPFCVYGTEVGVFHESDQKCFCSFLQAYNVLPWKCRSVLPTAWAISWTSREKESFLMRCSVLFWNYRISRRATVPGWYLLVFFTFPALRNSFWGALPPTVGQSFLLAGSSPKAGGLASAAIWAKCQVGDDDGDWPLPPAV